MVDDPSADEHQAEVIDLFTWRQRAAIERSKRRHPSHIVEDDSA